MNEDLLYRRVNEMSIAIIIMGTKSKHNGNPGCS